MHIVRDKHMGDGKRMRGGEGVPSRLPGEADTPAGGTLTIAAVPIGRLDDASGRFAAELAAAPIIAAEDTRRLRRLAARLGVELSGRVVSYYDAIEAQRCAELLAELRAGRDVLLVTDAGMPGVSDPGYRLTAAAAGQGIRVTVVPGPSAVTAALAVSGLPTDRFCFEGFPPRKAGERSRRFAELASERRTMVFFESPRRAGATLAELSDAFGAGRRAVVCRELTKTHEEIRRGTLADLAAWADAGLRGEVTLVVEGAPAAAPGSAQGAGDVGQAVAEVRRRVAGGMSRRDAIMAVAAEAGLPKRVVYDGVVSPRASS
jgi:16S rRNA (cytidine1402-2'-O)-methyltransferase